MTIEGLGKKFQQARLARKLTIEEAARITKIRPSRLVEIEAEDFSNFPNLAYAKGFLLIYGKFLNVDVGPYLEAFESSSAVTVDGYAYLQDNPAPKPATPVVRVARSRSSLKPLFVGIFVLVVGFALIRLILDISRISPARKNASNRAVPSATPTPQTIVAPRALPVESSPTPAIAANQAPAPSVAPVPEIAPPTPTPIPTEPEVRRAEPVHPEDLVRAGIQTAAAVPVAQTSPTNQTSQPNPSNQTNQVEVRPLTRTYIQVMVDDGSRRQSFERWLLPSDGPLRIQGRHVTVRVLDRNAVVIRKNGKRVSDSDADVTIE